MTGILIGNSKYITGVFLNTVEVVSMPTMSYSLDDKNQMPNAQQNSVDNEQSQDFAVMAESDEALSMANGMDVDEAALLQIRNIKEHEAPQI
ncbi:MAG: hypothetical protein HC810_05615 [Acaryochloridaceae cyanobacterium RL_2_7]|nr:hypothetical protein [Acaryochloridaceae cyanobacterium RL_2_7]